MMEIPDSFNFNESVSNNFDDHVREQLPWYDLATSFVCHLSLGFLNTGGTLLDVGCSTGNITKKLKKEINDRNLKTESVDSSEHMRAMYRGDGDIIIADICDYKLEKYDVIVSMLSLMFIPISKRNETIERLKKSLNAGGILIIVDKVMPGATYGGMVSSKMTILSKMNNGVKADDILKKEISLIGVQRPFSYNFFSENDFIEFFRFGDFVGAYYEA